MILRYAAGASGEYYTRTRDILAHKRGESKNMKLYRLVCLAILACAQVFGQATAQIQGVVQDATGSAVPGAEVKATQTDTGVVRTTTSSAEGTYVLPNLPIGPYKIDVTKSGFTSYEQTGIVLQVNTN